MSFQVSGFIFCLAFFLNYGPNFSEMCYYNMVHHATPLPEGQIPNYFGKPLLFDENLSTEELEGHKNFSLVKLLNTTFDSKGLISFSGFITIDKIYESNMFFWFFPALSGGEQAPLIIWLQGGPGLSSLVSIFAGNGPLSYNKTIRKIMFRKKSWAIDFNMLYLDSPIGSGFSYCADDRGYTRNQTQITKQLMIAIERFFSIFTDYQRNDIYIAGEGYSCKTIFSLANELHVKNGGQHKLKLLGVMIGNGICDWGPLTNHTPILRAVGLIDNIEAKEIHRRDQLTKKFLEMNEYDQAFEVLSRTFKDRPLSISLYRKMTGYESLYDYTKPQIPDAFHDYTESLNLKEMRQSLHVGSVPFGDHDFVCQSLIPDLGVQISSEAFKTVVNKYKVLLYHGRRDLLVPYSTFAKFLNRVFQEQETSNKTAKHDIWYRKEYDMEMVIGKVSKLNKITAVTLWNAGHFSSFDDPIATHDMIHHFIYNEAFDNVQI